MEGYTSLIIAVRSNQSPLFIEEEIDGYKYPQGELICNKQNKQRKEIKH